MLIIANTFVSRTILRSDFHVAVVENATCVPKIAEVQNEEARIASKERRMMMPAITEYCDSIMIRVRCVNNVLVQRSRDVVTLAA